MDIKDLLIKRAMGFEVEETVEEYSDVNGELVLQKKKVTKKYIPPDSIALKCLLTSEVDDGEDLEKLSIEELVQLKDELLNEINDLT